MAHNDHLQEPTLERLRGTATGVYYKGVGAVMRPGYILVAPDMDSLREIWGKITEIPLNEDKCHPLAVFQPIPVGEAHEESAVDRG